MFSLIKGKKTDDMEELLAAVQAYFYIWKNVGKKPGWCQRTEKAKSDFRKILKKHGRDIA